MEALLLNEIYSTNFFSFELVFGNIDYQIIFKEFLLFSKEIITETRLNNYILEIISIANYISNPNNFSCFDNLVELMKKINDAEDVFREFYQNNKTKHSFLDVIVFSSLHNCKLWTKLFKIPNKKIESNVEESKADVNPLESLFKWFYSFETTFFHTIKYRFNPKILPPKHKKQQEKLSKLKKRHPEFLNAVREKNIEKIIDFLKSGVDIQVVDGENGDSAAHIACLNGDLPLCKLLDEFSVNWEAENLENITPLFNAIENGNMELIQYLFQKKVNFEHLDFQKRTPFYHACCFGKLEVIEFLYFKCNCNPNTKSNKNRTALSKACFLALTHVVKFLLSLPKEDFPELNSIDDKGRTALHNAAWGPLGGKEGKYLHGVLVNDSPESAEMLLEKGATVDFADFDGNTPFIIAAASEGLGTMRVLYKYGADINKKNLKGENALHLACQFGHKKSIILLIEEMKADHLALSTNQISALACSLINDNFEVFDYLSSKTVKSLQEYQSDFSQIISRKKNCLPALNKLLSFLTKNKISLLFQSDYIPFLSSLEQKDSFTDFFNFFKEQMTDLHKGELFYKLIEKNKLNLFGVFWNLDQEFYKTFQPNTGQIIELMKSKPISSDFFQSLLIKTHFDILNTQNLLTFITDNHLTSFLIIFTRIFSEENKKIENKFLKNFFEKTKDERELEILEFLLQRNSNNEMNAFEYAKFKKAFDVDKILKDFSKSCLGDDTQIIVENYHIPYKIIDVSKEETTNFFHSKKSLLEDLNTKIEKDPLFATQYMIKHPKEFDFFEKILKNPLEFAKKNSFMYIQTEEELKKFYDEIQEFTLFGIDLEYHTTCHNEILYFDVPQPQSEIPIPSTTLKNPGFVCTLQISTIETDYIIDTLYLRDKVGKYLKNIFEDLGKVKVFHGGDFDLQWLKVDFEIDVVNVFDTARAYLYLSNDKNAISLLKLAKNYLNISLDKSFQKSFWAMRPLPKVMLDYARMDSWVLLGLFPLLMRDLESKGIVSLMAIGCNRLSWEKIEKIKMKRTEFTILK